MSPAIKKPRIMLVTDSYWPVIGGVEQWVHLVALYLSPHYCVTVITHAPGAPFDPTFIFSANTTFSKDDGGNAVTTLAPQGIARLILAPLLAWRAPLARKLFPKRLHDGLYCFYKTVFIKKMIALLDDVDIVHCFSTGYLAVCAGQACLQKKIPCVQSPPVHFGKWGDSPLLLRTYARASTILCLSDDFKNRFARCMPGATVPIIVNPAPVSIPKTFKKTGNGFEKPFILFLGRREAHKGLALLLTAFKALPSSAYLVIAGPGEVLPHNHSRIVDYGEVENSVKHWLLENCSLLCVPSREESFGIVYAEAMAHGKPVVALDVAPVNELVLNGITGLLTPPGRSDLLAHAIKTLLTDEALAQRMGKEGKKRFSETFEAGRVMQRLLAVYKSVVDAGNKVEIPRTLHHRRGLFSHGKKGPPCSH